MYQKDFLFNTLLKYTHLVERKRTPKKSDDVILVTLKKT